MARRGRACGTSPGRVEYLLERSCARTRGFAGRVETKN
jgi:hypothetical protein